MKTQSEKSQEMRIEDNLENKLRMLHPGLASFEYWSIVIRAVFVAHWPILHCLKILAVKSIVSGSFSTGALVWNLVLGSYWNVLGYFCNLF